MQDRLCHNNFEERRSRPRWGSLANERILLDILDGDRNLQTTPVLLNPQHSNIYARRHSAHTCPITEERHVPATTSVPTPPPVPLRPPMVPKRTFVPPQVVQASMEQKKNPNQRPFIPNQPPPLPPTPKCRTLPTIPGFENKPRPPVRNSLSSSGETSPNLNLIHKRNFSPKYAKHTAFAFERDSIPQEYSTKIPPAPSGPPPPIPKGHKPQNTMQKPPPTPGRGIRQDSSISSDSFSQTSSPSYTSKTMETPLIPPKHSNKQKHNGLLQVNPICTETEESASSAITKSASTPASLQAVVKFHNGSNMSLHHRIIRDIRRPSSVYGRRLRFGLAQVLLNAVALLAIGGGMAAYFKAYPANFPLYNTTTIVNVTTSPVIIERLNINPAPGICLPVIVNFCQVHKVPYNFTVYPNYMGQFGQRDAQQELEVYDAVVDVRCYELAALFLCSLFVPKCGASGIVVRPCRGLCNETKRRCGFFLDVFGLSLPEYLDCELFPESKDPNVCVGHKEVQAAKIRALQPVCPNGFQCDKKRCIPKDWQCDGHVDCKDQSDELNCNKCGIGMIHCGADKCITQEHMCDGKVDCPWGQDERNCLRLSERNGDEGKGQLEVYRPDQEKWVPACVAHWDQRTSAKTICSLLGYSTVNTSRLLKGTDIKSPVIRETTALWRMNQNKRPKNMLREFGSCNKSTYPTVDLSCINYACGKARKSYAERRTTRIVGGVRSKPGDWPFLAALLGGPEEVFYCAGVLIADQWVLTASHCVGNHSDVSGWTIQLGITRRHAHSFYGQKMKVKRVVPHPNYNLVFAHDNDIALFQLSARVTFHEHLSPVCLPPAAKRLIPGTVCTVIGWGKKEDTGLSEYEPEINEVEVPVLNRDLCNSWLENRDLNITDGMICAGYKEGGKDACQGDSGGPLLCREKEDPDRWFVGGIVSWGIKCAHPHLPGVYAYVPKYIPWIKQQIQNYID